MHPLLQLLATRPQLLADHAEAYGALLSADISQASAAWQRRAGLNLVALCCLAVSATLFGVALMLWAVVPTTQINAAWVLVAVPLLPLVLSLACLIATRFNAGVGPFDNLRRQVKTDLAMLREEGAA